MLQSVSEAISEINKVLILGCPERENSLVMLLTQLGKPKINYCSLSLAPPLPNKYEGSMASSNSLMDGQESDRHFFNLNQNDMLELESLLLAPRRIISETIQAIAPIDRRTFLKEIKENLPMEQAMANQGLAYDEIKLLVMFVDQYKLSAQLRYDAYLTQFTQALALRLEESPIKNTLSKRIFDTLKDALQQRFTSRYNQAYIYPHQMYAPSFKAFVTQSTQNIIEYLEKTNANKKDAKLLAAEALRDTLVFLSKAFFDAPYTAETRERFIQNANQAVTKAEDTLKMHRGWFGFSQIFRGFIGCLATISVIPAIVVACSSGYKKTFFQASPMPDSQQLLGRFQNELNNEFKKVDFVSLQ